MSSTCGRALAIAALIGSSAAADVVAAAPRTFVSTMGVDNVNCSLAAPCRTFAAAVTAVNAGGEVIVLDSGGYGPVTLAKAVTIETPAGVYAGVTVSSGDGVLVDAGSGDRVVLRGLAINGQGGANGVRVQAAAVVHVERCTINGVSQGILFEPGAASKLVVADSVVRNNTGRGVHAAPLAGGVGSHVEVWRSEVTHNGADGILFVNVARASVGDTLSANNAGAGIWVATTPLSPSDTHVAVDRSQLVGNLAGIVTAGSSGALAVATVTRSVLANTAGAGALANHYSRIELSSNQISGNDTGTLVFGMPPGVIESAGDNVRVSNATPGDPASPITPY